ncbi:ABC transporter permease [Gammaproteobacteria bacterium]|nr:ABC transporter permease [Gammaproteobacteria bacterium]
MSIFALMGAIQVGLIYSLVAIGVFISFRVLDFPDLTVDGSFPLGAAVTAALLVAGVNPFIAMGAAVISGFIAGILTAWLNLKLNILNLLASILTMIALYSINIRIMGGPNISLLSRKTIFTPLDNGISLGSYSIPSYILLPIGLSVMILILCFIIIRFLNSEIGLAMRATGKNTRMSRANGINTILMIGLGMGISNALVALAGSLFAQSEGFSDVTTGVGTIVIGLAAVIAGETLFPTRSILWSIFACIFGSIIYRLMIALALEADFIGLQASDLNLVTAVLVGFALVLPVIRQKFKKTKRGVQK